MTLRHAELASFCSLAFRADAQNAKEPFPDLSVILNCLPKSTCSQNRSKICETWQLAESVRRVLLPNPVDEVHLDTDTFQHRPSPCGITFLMYGVSGSFDVFTRRAQLKSKQCKRLWY
jgi:hypothetical protein